MPSFEENPSNNDFDVDTLVLPEEPLQRRHRCSLSVVVRARRAMAMAVSVSAEHTQLGVHVVRVARRLLVLHRGEREGRRRRGGEVARGRGGRGAGVRVRHRCV